MPAARTKNKKRTRPSHDADGAPSSKRVKPDSAGSLPYDSTYPGVRAQVQEKFCLSSAYKDVKLSRCTSCSRRNGMDTCRFRDVRHIIRDPAGRSLGVAFHSQPAETKGRVVFPDAWNTEPCREQMDTTKRVIAEALLPTLQNELAHLEQPGIICRPREVDVRATCDTCMTSLFSQSWMCRRCGREACAECWAKLSSIPPDAIPASVPKDRRDPEKRLLACIPRESHDPSHFFPVSRFAGPELRDAIRDMRSILDAKMDSGSPKKRSPSPELQYPTVIDNTGPSAALDLLASVVAAHPRLPDTLPPPPLPRAQGSITLSPFTPKLPIHALPDHAADIQLSPSPQVPSTETTAPQVKAGTPPRDIEDTTTSSVSEPLSSPLLPLSPSTSTSELSSITMSSRAKSPAPLSSGPEDTVPFHPTVTFSDAMLTDETFHRVWKEGRPLVVNGLLDKFHVNWTPEYFISKYGDQGCMIVDCVTESKREVNVRWFFAKFGKYSERDEPAVWKLKDWPPSTDFQSAFPELYDDFARAVPVPSYCRRDGVLNIASHFPPKAVAPDLGPKMYNAFATSDTEGSKGSTRLHMDMADAVNMMVYAAPCPDGSPGGARWDLFRAEDAPVIRQFLGEQYKLAEGLDPIHSQQFYLDKKLRAALYAKTGVRSHCVIQRPGEAVFIPAGCAHQVCNLSDCIKVAADFVSPENIERCARLTDEFRAQNLERMWKEDVLQLQTMMWYAWVSCSRPEIVKGT
ncbi:hypothetical protein BC834DRAFT_969419 [Gloeopeniophorella convolvens]|nr:hypothetical protein BC834DRAFT_969419 [Gloeopeniophorella convolvens]